MTGRHFEALRVEGVPGGIITTSITLGRSSNGWLE